MATITTPPQSAPFTPTTPPPTDEGPRPWKWTREQYYKLGELGFFKGKRVELIHGEIVEMSPINRPHSLAVGLVADELARIFASGFHISVQQPFRVQVAGLVSEPEPDVAVIPGARRDLSDHPTQATLLVEVSDSMLSYDTAAKAELYASAGVGDYWVLDIKGRKLHVFRDPGSQPAGLGANAYKTRLAFDHKGSVSPAAAPNATIRVADLLP